MSETTSLTQKDRTDVTTPEITRGGVCFTPRVDIYEMENELTVYADMPGVRSEDIDLRFERGELVLHGRVQPRHPDQDFVLQEYQEGDFYRAFAVHESIDGSRITAECKNGVLIVHLPKTEKARPKQIKVR